MKFDVTIEFGITTTIEVEAGSAKEARRHITGKPGASFNTLTSQLYEGGDFWMFGLKVVKVKPHKEIREEENRHEAATQG